MCKLLRLCEKDIKKINETVKEVERKTSGEIVPAIVSQSDGYPGALWRIAFSLSLLLTYSFYYFYDYFPFYYYLIIQVLCLPVGFLVGKIPFIFRLAITKRELKEEVYQRALEMFHAQGLSNTRDRTGVLIFVSKLERQVIILADAGINQKVPQNFWDELIKKMLEKIKKGNLSEAFIDVISETGKYLSEHFPKKDDDTNELSDNLVIE